MAYAASRTARANPTTESRQRAAQLCTASQKAPHLESPLMGIRTASFALFCWRLAAMLRNVAPEPGEYIRGHAGRLALWNGFSGAKELVAFLDRKEKRGWTNDFSVSVYRLFSPFSGLNLGSYLRWHSLLPFCRVGSRGDDAFDYDGPTIGSARTALKQPKKGAFLCPRCIARDERMLGYSYWRAFHQLPGIDACPVHDIALAVVMDINAFEQPPGSWEGAQPVCDEIVSVRAVPAVARYVEIAHAFMSRGHRVQRIGAGQCIAKRVAEIRLQTERNNRRSTLVDYIREAFPEAWLQAHYPRLSSSERSEKIDAVNALCFGKVVDGIVYAMALASTFSTGREAIDAFYSSQDGAPLTRVTATKSVKMAARLARLLPHYLAGKGRVAHVAESLDISFKAASSRLKSVGLPLLGNAAESDRQRIIAFLSAASKSEIDRWIAAGSDVKRL